ncbi:alpha/beta fold hydrolase [Erwinia piriflorinigrans]|uniref:AB hydrolase-1 domain-containing protein n=1 Tax=Erwinia piriflorinigrans CFBP 5888 TaxID=1161919 RepID=V5Z9H7_9GAMM|nr:alpha/beta hydrolase [Erwinia piriflorinigrans]CCG87608.1 hypothetical protein EPIR_2243 [Erwinia piriflorinigrans CFBP 5888]
MSNNNVSGTVPVSHGIDIYYETRGEGFPLLILNNFFMTSEQWRPLTKHIASKFKVINYDLRHQGRSSRTEDAITLEDHLDDLTVLIEKLGLDKFYLMGTCVSTLIARDYAMRHPERVKGVVMVGPIFSPYGDLPRKLMHRSLINSLKSGGGEALFDHYYPLLYTPKTQQSNQKVGYLALKARFLENNSDEQLLKHLSSTVDVVDNPDGLANLVVPTILISGEEDPFTSRRGLRLLEKMIPDCVVELIEATGHNPYIESNSVFESCIVRFMDTICERDVSAESSNEVIV